MFLKFLIFIVAFATFTPYEADGYIGVRKNCKCILKITGRCIKSKILCEKFLQEENDVNKVTYDDFGNYLPQDNVTSKIDKIDPGKTFDATMANDSKYFWRNNAILSDNPVYKRLLQQEEQQPQLHNQENVENGIHSSWSKNGEFSPKLQIPLLNNPQNIENGIHSSWRNNGHPAYKRDVLPKQPQPNYVNNDNDYFKVKKY